MRKTIIDLISVILIIAFFAISAFSYSALFHKDTLNLLDVILICLPTIICVLLYEYISKKKKQLTENKVEYSLVGEILFEKHKNEFLSYYKTQSTNKTSIEFIYHFALRKALVQSIDWKGEENESEIEEFIENVLRQKIQ